MLKRKNNKKGFTIVELTIVVSVIAILSAVLIPTFAGVTKRARLSADQQAVRQMNIQIAATNNIDTIDNLEEAMNTLDEAGYNALDTLVPVSKNHAFYWDNDNKSVVLVNKKDYTVAYPENYKSAFNTAWANLRDDGVKVMDNINVATVNDFEDLLDLGAKKVTLTQNLNVKKVINVPENSNTVVDLNGKKFDASKQGSRPFELANGATLTVKGGDIACGAYGLVNIPVNTSATVVIEDATITADLDDGAFIKVRKGATANITLNNLNYTNVSDDSFIVSSSDGTDNITLTVNGGNYKSTFGFIAHNLNATDVTIETSSIAFEVVGGDSTIKDCTIKTGSTNAGSVPAAGIVAEYKSSVTVENCTMTSKNLDFLVVNTGGSITATGTYSKYNILNLDPGVTGYIDINGTVVAGEKPQA